MKKPKEHAKKCASFVHKYSGDARNPHVNPDSDAMKECDCDGYHTFTELYDHRITLWIALCRMYKIVSFAWRSKLHSDGSSFDGWFILGLHNSEGKQITYHLPLSRWEEADFAETFDRAPEFDGHTSDDVLERLKKL